MQTVLTHSGEEIQILARDKSFNLSSVCIPNGVVVLGKSNGNKRVKGVP